MTLDVSGTITGISPTVGSRFGGTIVTITGTNFDTDPLNNPVNINWAHCEIISSSTTKIEFRTPNSTNPAGHNLDSYAVVVGLKTSEEAECKIDSGCSFTYTDVGAETPELTAMTAEN